MSKAADKRSPTEEDDDIVVEEKPTKKASDPEEQEGDDNIEEVCPVCLRCAHANDVEYTCSFPT